jgi:hypothetical protein
VHYYIWFVVLFRFGDVHVEFLEDGLEELIEVSTGVVFWEIGAFDGAGREEVLEIVVEDAEEIRGVVRGNTGFGGETGEELLADGAEVGVVVFCSCGLSGRGILEENPCTRAAGGVGVDLLDLL